jgi:tetratricopeptide (TPR) repeat protein
MELNTVQNDTTRPTLHIRSILQFVNSIDAKTDNGLLFGWKYYNDDDHGSVPLITEYDALRFLFSWYTFHGLNQFYDPASNTSAQELIDVLSSHYENVSDQLGYKVLPPEQFINSNGYGFMNNKMLDKASALFDLNIQNYPGSSNVYDSRGDCYLAQQDSVKALEYFVKAMEIGDNDFSQQKIDMLKEKLKN